MRIELCDWQITRMCAYVLCSDGSSNSNSSWLLTLPPPLLSPFLFFLTKTNSYLQLTTKRTHKRAYIYGFCSFCIPWLSYVPTPQWVFLLKCLWYFDDITSRLFASLPQMDRITVMSVLPLDHICTNIVISLKFGCITSVIFIIIIINPYLVDHSILDNYAVQYCVML